jgi:sugar phosphate isomerase/epimerase
MLDAKFLNFHGPLKLKKQAYNLDYDKLANTINNLCETAQRYKLKLSYENIHYGFFDSPDFFESIKSLCPDLYATVDIKQAVQAGHDPIDYIDVVGDRLSTVHICDVGYDNTPCLPLQGQVEFNKFFNHLVRKRIDVPIMMELYPSNYKNGLQDLVDCYESIKKIIDSTKGNVVEFKN